MTKYVRAKKYLRVFVPVLIVAGAILVPKVDHSHKAKTLGAYAQSQNSSVLQVSRTGSPMYTDITADNLQPAGTPEHSATTSSLNPQQAVPNYCTPGEQPYIDGCISAN